MLVFHDPSLSGALERVRSELGPDALILKVEHVLLGGRRVVRIGAQAPRARARRAIAGATRPRRAVPHTPERTIAVVGPPGSGKTTIAVKVASHLTRDLGIRALVHALGSTTRERLERLANGAGIELAAECRLVARGAAGGALVIDTPGLIPGDHARLDEIARGIAERGARQIHLVLPATAGDDWVRNVARSLSGLSPRRLILTQVDMVTPARVVRLARASGLPLSYLGTGPTVTGDLVGRTSGEIRRYLMQGGNDGKHSDAHAA